MNIVYDVATVTCRSAGCVNGNVGISVYRRPNNKVVCGVCGNVITDIVKTGTVTLDE